MKEIQSEVDENLILLEDGEAFAKHARQIVEQGRRELAILSSSLDPYIYDRTDFADLVSSLARGDRKAEVRIQVKDIRPLVERGHRLLKLARRLSSKVHIRKLLIEPENDTRAYLIGDRGLLLYKHDDTEYKGFANYRAGPEANALLDVFNHLWEQHSTVDPSLRNLRI
ncbi:MAG: hypothetical protein WDZ30_04445 [Cellvibrionaceae bacterium]